jgi:hypothetical protein
MLPEIATPRQIKKGKTRKHNETCWECYPQSCHCPQTPSEVYDNLRCYLSEMKRVLTDKEKKSINRDIEELKERYNLGLTPIATL